MDMAYFSDRRPFIEKSIRDFFDRRLLDTGTVNRWGSDVCGRVLEFTLQGKMIRGGLVLLAHDIFGGKNTADAGLGACAMELFQSAFLIHDDIMDRDETRRGKASVFAQYMNETGVPDAAENRRLGESLGICAGDISFFMGYQSLAELSCVSSVPSIMGAVSRELSIVGAAQMQDVYFGHVTAQPSLDDIIRMYVQKTGRYTFSLPLMLGAMIAGAEEKNLERFSVLGEKMGIVFQIKDDELGLFGSGTGKVSGSDIRENKKSIFRYYLFSRIRGEDVARCEALFGNPDIIAEDIDYVRAIVRESGIRAEIGRLALNVSNEALAIIDEISASMIGNGYLDVLRSLVSYSFAREK
jgi:geranylgeranyl diphosphate synthase type I